MATQVTVITGSGSTAYTVNLDRRGPQGIQGVQGEKGDQGIQGEVGPPGPTDYNLLTNVPATFPPSAHTHVVSNITPVSGTHLIGRHAGGSGDAQEVSVGNGVEFQGSGIRRSALTGDVTASAGSNSTTIANDAVTTAKIINDAVTNGKLANMATATIKGRATAGTGDPEDLTPAQARTVIGVSPALVVSDTAPTTPVDGQQWLRLTSEIFSIWSTTKNRWVIPFTRSDPDAQAYIDAVKAAGGAVTATQESAINEFFIIGKADGWYSSLKRIYLPIWAAAAPNAVDMVTRASGTFTVSGVTHSAGHVAGDGSTGYFDTNARFDTLGLTVSSGYLFALIYSGTLASLAQVIGAGTAAAGKQTVLGQAATVSPARARLRYSGAGTASVEVNTPVTGIISGSRTTGNRSIYRRISTGTSTLISTDGGDSGTLPESNVYALAQNNNDSIGGSDPAAFSDVQLGSYGFGMGLSSTQNNAFTLALKNLWETCTGLTIP